MLHYTLKNAECTSNAIHEIAINKNLRSIKTIEQRDYKVKLISSYAQSIASNRLKIARNDISNAINNMARQISKNYYKTFSVSDIAIGADCNSEISE